MNKVILLGRLTADPETKYTQSNTAVCKFSIAVDRPTKQGEERQADFFKVTVWGKTGEFVNSYFQKGQRILVEGRLQNNNYEDKNGVKHYSNDVVAERVHFVEGKKQAQDKPQAINEGLYPLPADDDLPF